MTGSSKNVLITYINKNLLHRLINTKHIVSTKNTGFT